MSRKPSAKKQTSTPTSDIEWHDEISDDARKNPSQSLESGCLDAMNDIVQHLARSSGAGMEDMGKKKWASSSKTRIFLRKAAQKTPVFEYVYGKPSPRKALAPINSPLEI